jgi:NifU-like protein involved in Fe-S cluster formation
MNTQGFVTGPLSVLCIVALVMGTASAAMITAADSTSGTDTAPVQKHPSPESIIDSLEQQGVDVTEVKTALQNGDTDAVKAWLEAHRPARPDGPARSPPDLTDATRQQEIITGLEEKGVDVTEVKADLQNGDTDAVKAWLENYFQAHRPAAPDGAGSPPRSRRYHQAGEIHNRLETEGVDVTGVKTELENGDTTAVKEWLENYLHAHEGEMPFRHPPGETQRVGQTGTSQ